MSLRTRLLVQVLRRFVKPRSLARPDPIASRIMMERFARPMPSDVLGTVLRIGGVPVERVRSRGVSADAPTLIYLHGGAYVLSSPATHRPITVAFARRGFRVVAPEYRLAPEHPFPAALDDAVAVYRGLLDGGVPPGRIALAGESAGGGLALSTLLRLRDLGLPAPAAAALFSPWTDLALTGATLRSNDAVDPIFHARHAVSVAAHYLGDADPYDPLASPVYADLSDLPPLLIHVGKTEILLDDSLRVADRARAAGTDVSLRVWPRVPHGWQLLASILPEARRSVDEAAAFIKARVAARAARVAA